MSTVSFSSRGVPRSARCLLGAAALTLVACGDSQDARTGAQSAATHISYGTWVPWVYSSVLAVHAALMPPKDANTPAKVVYFGGSEYEPTLQNWVYTPGPPTPNPPTTLGGISRNAWEEYNTGTGVITRLNVPLPALPPNSPQSTPDDLFCSAHAHGADGKLVIVGGNEYYLGDSGLAGQMPASVTVEQIFCSRTGTWMNVHRCAMHFTGTKSVFRFDHGTNTLARGVFMAKGRWYPTLVRAYHGSTETFLTLSGHTAHDEAPTSHPHHHTPWVEVASATTLGAWQKNPTDHSTVEMYPRAFYTPYRVAGSTQGSIVVASPNILSHKSSTLTPIAASPNQFAAADIANAHIANSNYHKFFTSAVLLPLRPSAAGVYPAGRILMTNDTVPIILDLSAASPQWKSAGSVLKPRVHANATILATGDVLVSGGVNHLLGAPPLVPFNDGHDGRLDHSVYEVDVFREDRWNSNPLVNPWDVGASATIGRNYHHVALLLPNGAVLTAGGNKGGNYSRTYQFTREGRVLRTELFIPWYAQPGVTRPTINKTATLNPPRSGAWVITTGSGTPGTSITRVALIAPGSVTHAFNVGQRYVELWRNSSNAATVTVTVPGDQSVLPSGWYMLVVSHSSNNNPAGAHIPSEAHWVQVP